MELDGRQFGEGTVLETDLCIVGAGPAGLALANALEDASISVLVVESGGWVPDPTMDQLNAGEWEGDSYAGLEATRGRLVGGTAGLWNTAYLGLIGAKYTPLDAGDLEGLDGRPEWPLSLDELLPFYAGAHRLLGLGEYQYHGALPIDDPDVVPRLYRFGSMDRLRNQLPRSIVQSGRVSLSHHLTVTSLVWRGSRVEGVAAATPSGSAVTIRARWVVLAGGAVENARLLMVAAARDQWVDRSGWLGRGFMEHPRSYALMVRPESADQLRRLEWFDIAEAPDGQICCGRLGLSERAMLEGGLLNASLTLLPKARRHWWSPGWERILVKLRMGRRSLGYGWSRLALGRQQIDGFRGIVNLEQLPHRENCLTLGQDRDGFGTPRVRLRWRWREEDHSRLGKTLELFRRGVQRLGVGSVELGRIEAPDPNAHHHAGTTRMALTAERGVVDRDGRVYGADNLFVVGASTFPTVGFANPTLTIVAMSLRLAQGFRADGGSRARPEPKKGI